MEELVENGNMVIKLIEEVKLDGQGEIEKEINSVLPMIKKETISLENGAQGHFFFADAP